MWYQFLLENSHFAVNLFSALAFFSIFWLYFDAWLERKTWKEGMKILGLLLLSISFLLHATLIESSSFSGEILSSTFNEKLSLYLKNFGYLVLLIGLILDPLIDKPKLAMMAVLGSIAPYLLAPILAMIVAWMYLRRATIGLENHTKKVTLAFYFFAFYEFLTAFSIFAKSSNVDLFRLVAPFGTLWLVAHGLLLVGSAILIVWTFYYLLKRISTQLFIISTTTTLVVFLLTTVSFTFLLLKNISDETLARLRTDVSVLSFALDAKKSEALSQATILAQNTKVAVAIDAADKKTLSNLAEELLLAKKVNSVLILSESGQVLARGEDRERVGDSLSSDSLVKRVLIGESVFSMTTKDAATAPVVSVRAGVPIKADGKVVGVVVVAISLDNSFLDGIKKATLLEVSVYGGEVLAATTISDLRGTTRPVGIKETNRAVREKVITKGESFSGQVSILNTSYFAVYSPLKDVDGSVVGMLLIGRPGASIFAAASRSIELTFLVTVGLIILSVFPSFWIAKYISNQLD